MPTRVNPQSADLSSYSDLVVVYLGMRVNRRYGLRTLLGHGPRIGRSATDQPDGLLAHESMVWSLSPMHVGMCQYWRDLPSLLAWTRSRPHRSWWRNFLRDSGGTDFWHETYRMGAAWRRCSTTSPNLGASRGSLRCIRRKVPCSARPRGPADPRTWHLSSAWRSCTPRHR
ncbi:monooxygenase family protein [Catellatospora coxensis]